MHHDISKSFGVDCVWLIYLDRKLSLATAGKERKTMSHFLCLDQQLLLLPHS